MKIVFHRLARRELYRAADWYDYREPGLSDRLYGEVEKAFAFIRQFPNGTEEIGHSCRRAVLYDFPYSLIYSVIEPGTVLIIAVAHQRRRPGYWRKRLTK